MYADILRIITVFFVILIHTVADAWYALPQQSFNWEVMNAFDSISRWTVPVFFMLSGAYILDPEKEITTQKIYGKYILHVSLALLFWGIFYQLYTIIDAQLFENTPFTPAALSEIPKKFIFGFPYVHLWYIYRLIGLYMLAPVIRIFTAHASKKDIEYILILSLAIGSALPFANLILKNSGSTLAISFKIIELTGFVFFYIAGYYFRKYDVTRSLRIVIYIAGIAGAVATALLTSFYSLKTGAKTEDFYENMNPNVIAMALAIFVGFKQIFGEKHFTDRQKAVIIYVSSCTFGMYLTHFLFIRILSRLNITTGICSPFLCVPAIAAACYLLSFCFTVIIKCIKPLAKFIV